MMIWRPVIRGMCTLSDLKSTLSIDDLADMNEALDLQDAIEADAAKAAEQKAKRR